MPTRTPVVAGQFYPSRKMSLEKELSNLTKKSQIREKVYGAIVPHAGYVYSGGVAGEVFSRLAPSELYVILGPNHTGRGKAFSVFSEGDWDTPLGSVEIDSDFAAYLISNSSLYKKDSSAHSLEHSIEVQLPFLQHLMKDFKILPICVGGADLEDLKRASSELAKALQDSKKNVTIIASTDMTHYEPHNVAKAKDMEALTAILKMDEDGLWKKVNEMNISMCGIAPVIMMLRAAKNLGAKSAELVDYKTSGDTSGDYSSVVGYAGVLIK
ncbi:MAG: AmmeMemoRadiSam system protein B [Candidatus Omnitrophica bacterium]|nr:AmmeMemoRadiSam system protein B [Candidatus Omnitrophota bacterium]